MLFCGPSSTEFGMTEKDMEKNLVELISSEEDPDSASNQGVFLCEDEVMEVIRGNEVQSSTNTLSTKQFYFQEPVAVVWDEETASRSWYIGFVLEEENNFLTVDHLERSSSSDEIWQRPKVDDVQSVAMVQIIPLPVEGEWNFSDRAPKFKVHNYISLDRKMKELWH